METPYDILSRGNEQEILALFKFDLEESNQIILFRFGLWARYFFPQYFKENDTSFHNEMDTNNLDAYRGVLKGGIKSFTDIVFRGGAKTSRTKLLFTFVILNDKNHFRRYMKVLCKDIANSKQSVTDIYNMLVSPRISKFYPNTFEKTDQKREESMGAFTTSFGVKLRAGVVGTEQRGALQEDARPDLIWFDDFETRKTLRSAVVSQSIWDNMEEAKTSLPPDGSGACIYTCNYVSERGNVHRLVLKENKDNIVLIVPIRTKERVPTWYHTNEFIDKLKEDAEDFEGEYLCNPAASKDIMFDRETIDNMIKRQPERTIAKFKIFEEYDASNRYASASDVAGGVGLDSSTNVIINFETVPARVVVTYKSNTVKPDSLGDEIERQNEYFNYPFTAIEKNNHGHATIGRMKQIYPIRKLFETPAKKQTTTNHPNDDEPKEYGWHTNALTKPKMFNDLAKAVNKGLLDLSDPDLIAEARSYTRNDFMDTDVDPRLTTRHFDLLTAAAICWQMKDFVGSPEAIIKEHNRIQEVMDSQDFDPYEVM